MSFVVRSILDGRGGLSANWSEAEDINAGDSSLSNGTTELGTPSRHKFFSPSFLTPKLPPEFCGILEYHPQPQYPQLAFCFAYLVINKRTKTNGTSLEPERPGLPG